MVASRLKNTKRSSTQALTRMYIEFLHKKMKAATSGQSKRHFTVSLKWSIGGKG